MTPNAVFQIAKENKLSCNLLHIVGREAMCEKRAAKGQPDPERGALNGALLPASLALGWASCTNTRRSGQHPGRGRGLGITLRG